MNKYYFTFGIGHELADHVQPIFSPNMKVAIVKMNELYGKSWAFNYTFDEYCKAIEKSTIRPRELNPVWAWDSNSKVMTFGEMKGWTDRFNSIGQTSSNLKAERLKNLQEDLKSCYNNDPFAHQFINTIEEVV